MAPKFTDFKEDLKKHKRIIEIGEKLKLPNVKTVY